jgi:SulP family sulfate permease
MRLGDLTRYVSHSVIVGFTLGASTLLVLDQMKNLFGWTAHGAAEDHFLTRFWLSLAQGGGVHWPTLLIGVGTIALVVAVRKFNDFCRRRGSRFPIPQHLVAIIIMAGLVWGLRLDAFGVAIVGAIPAALPPLQIPDLRWDEVQRLASSAFSVAVLGLLEAVAMSKSIASRTGHKLDINQQCLSEGAANLAGSFFQCIPGSGSLTRSAVNLQAGGVTQWSGVFSAVGVAGMVLLFAPLAQYIPRSALAGLLMLAAFRMVEGKQLRFHLRATKFDAGIVIATALAAVFISVEFCIVIGVFLSFMLYVPRASHVRLVQYTLTPQQRIRERRSTDTDCDRLLCYGLEGDLFFGAEPELHHHLAAIQKQASGGAARVVLLVLKGARNPDATFLHLLTTFQAKLAKQGVDLLLCAVQADLVKALAITNLDATIGTNRIFPDGTESGVSTHQAVLHAYQLLGENHCASCPRKRKEGGQDEPLVYEI